ncbi:MBL fold metallo-hydrolase [Humisphaera borealis]|uniref:MBL fold metallo-hydrolase n=1 Tax=Humisphaera borealis TaxID=2807512 RepID=A0A7M2WT04_9BACT|nr:MBL fold metallo-hydrolase [Humisphaera borealis]QOV88312.1 MBL fold metallo-hydrolase [Humisphaera borealis]
MQVLTARGGLFSTNCFLIADEVAKQAVIFDAPDNTVGVLLDQARKNGWNVIGLWLTHGHVDHIADHAAITEAFPEAKVLVHRLDEPKLLKPNSMFPLPFSIPARKADAYVDDGDVLKLGSLKVEVIHTPGHSPGHVCYHFADQKLLVGGDLIICGAVGRTDFPDCSHPALNASIRRIMRLPGDTRLLPGHCTPSTLAHELQTNEYVREAVEEPLG